MYTNNANNTKNSNNTSNLELKIHLSEKTYNTILDNITNNMLIHNQNNKFSSSTILLDYMKKIQNIKSNKSNKLNLNPIVSFILENYTYSKTEADAEGDVEMKNNTMYYIDNKSLPIFKTNFFNYSNCCNSNSKTKTKIDENNCNENGNGKENDGNNNDEDFTNINPSNNGKRNTLY